MPCGSCGGCGGGGGRMDRSHGVFLGAKRTKTKYYNIVYNGRAMRVTAAQLAWFNTFKKRVR